LHACSLDLKKQIELAIAKQPGVLGDVYYDTLVVGRINHIANVLDLRVADFLMFPIPMYILLYRVSIIDLFLIVSQSMGLVTGPLREVGVLYMDISRPIGQCLINT
jgi:hypothetical protein